MATSYNDGNGGEIRNVAEWTIIFVFYLRFYREDATEAAKLNRPEWSSACVSILHAPNLSDASS
jgi:hypothetical protein